MESKKKKKGKILPQRNVLMRRRGDQTDRRNNVAGTLSIELSLFATSPSIIPFISLYLLALPRTCADSCPWQRRRECGEGARWAIPHAINRARPSDSALDSASAPVAFTSAGLVGLPLAATRRSNIALTTVVSKQKFNYNKPIFRAVWLMDLFISPLILYFQKHN